MKKRVPIVAVGASAGGLEAVSQLLSDIDANFAYAVVILQHLSPNYKSMMAELLTRETRLNVETLADGTEPVPGVVYVVPPNCNALIRGDQLHLSEAAPEVSPKPSINEFFISLAQVWQEQAIGVVLSGTGSDGTAGLRAIQATGGITIAQSPETAKYEGMPVAAIDAGVADFVLAPGAIAQKLMGLPDAENLSDELSHSALDRIISILNQLPGQNFSGYKVGTLSRRVRRRMVATSHHSMDDYCQWLSDHTDEAELLAKDILISVTEFFRDPESFAVLRQSVAQAMENLSPDEEYRAWVAGCATGEEAYSVAILIMEELLAQGLANSVQLFATDIDEEALNVARQGVYPAQALAGMPDKLISRYFHRRKDQSFEVSKKLRDMIVFARHNVISDPPFFRLNLITCRNLLIYFDNALQAKVLQRFHFSLREQSLLFLGRSESVAQAEQLFSYEDRRERVFRKSGESHAVAHPRTGTTPGPVTIRRRESPQQLVDALTQYQSITVALCSLDGKILQTSGAVDQFFKFPAGATDTQLTEVVIPEFKSDLMTLLHRLKKSQQPQQSRMLEAHGKQWQLALNYSSTGNEARILLVISAVTHALAETPEKALSQLYTDELQVTQEQMQSLVEELATANEEMQSLNEEAQASNEELQATNEELEAANEELQATNEELVSVNEELSVKTAELGSLNEEYIHLYDSLDFPVLVFDESLHLLRFNTAAAFMMNLRRNARGTAVSRIRFPDWLQDIEVQLAQSLTHGEKYETLVEHNERFIQVVINPGLDDNEQIRFVVLNLIDVTDIQNTRDELNASENRLQTIMDNTTILIAMKDLQGRYLYVNDAFKRAYAVTEPQYELKSDYDLFPDEFASQLWTADLKAIRTLKMVESELSLMIDGALRYFSTRHQVLRDQHGKPNIIITESEEITTRKKAEEKLKIAAKVYQQAGEAIVVTNKYAQILSVNEAFSDITGYSEKEAVGVKIGELLSSGRHSGDFFRSLWHTLDEQGHWQGEIWNKRKNGEIYPEWLTINRILNEQDETDYYIAVFSDISNLKDSQRKVEFLATHDALTGLPNRNLFFDRLENAIARSKRSDRVLAVLYLDLDNFKGINDTLGHDMGDLLLVEVAKELRAIVRDVDTVSRLGGDEFTVILGECEPSDAQDIAERILAALGEPIQLGERRVFTSTSIGISFYPEDARDSMGLLKAADTAMYKAKESGRNQFRFFHYEMREVLLKQSTLESALKDAIRHRHFRLVYQPKYLATHTHSIVGAEALLRWRDTHAGEISPGEFIPIAERSTAIIELSNLVADMVAEQIARWLSQGVSVPPIAINVSAQCLKLENYAADLIEIIDRYLVPYRYLKIEITESSLMDSTQIVFDNLNALTEKGFEISIDDFGTGYSSLGYLKQLPLNEIKIDKSFVDGLGTDEDDEAICQAILSMSKALRLTVVAEGVETAEQQQWLVEKECDCLQGFLLSRPLEVADFEQLLVLTK